MMHTGSFFWNFKIEQNATLPTYYDAWNYLQGVAQGWIPSNTSASVTPYAFSCADAFPNQGYDSTKRTYALDVEV